MFRFFNNLLDLLDIRLVLKTKTITKKIKSKNITF